MQSSLIEIGVASLLMTTASVSAFAPSAFLYTKKHSILSDSAIMSTSPQSPFKDRSRITNFQQSTIAAHEELVSFPEELFISNSDNKFNADDAARAQEVLMKYTTEQQKQVGLSVPPTPVGDVAKILAGLNSSELTNDLAIRLKVMAKTASRSVSRMAHASLGLASLALGTYHIAHCCIQGFGVPITQSEIITISAVHTSCAIMGLPRLNFKSKSQATRNAALGPMFFHNIWCACAALTEWSQGPDALFSMTSDAMIAFTIANFAITVWQMMMIWEACTDKEQQKTGLWYDAGWKSVVASFCGWTFWVQIILVAYLHTAVNVDMDTYSSLIASAPDLGYVISNVMIIYLFLNNGAAFLATLFQSKAIRDVNVLYWLPVAVSVLSSALFVMPALMATGNGEAFPDFVELLAGIRVDELIA